MWIGFYSQLSSGYALVTTSNFAQKSEGDPALPLYFSTDLVWPQPLICEIFEESLQVNWIPKGHVFPAGGWPDWAIENMWAPEIHFVNGTFVVYFTGEYNVDKESILKSLF